MFPADMRIAGYDDALAQAIADERRRQEDHVELIASENYASPRVLEAQGSVLTNKYAEGYPGKRYYGGCEFVDVAENAGDRARASSCSAATTPTCSRIPARRPTRPCTCRCCSPGDKILGMSLAHGGHLTHGAKVNISGKLFDAAQYGVDANGMIDYDEVEKLAREHKPKMLVAGFSAYSQVVDWARMREIADDVGALLFVDMAHVAGLVAAGVYPSPLPHAHVVTSTTHKTLRGPRGGIVLAKNPSEELVKKLQSIVFPGIQGGPLMHVIAAKAVAFKEALDPEFKAYQKQVVLNAKAMAKTLMAPRLQGRFRRHREPPDADRPDRPRHHRQGRRGRARQGAHHRQQERRAERPALALRHLRPAHRHAGGDHARLQGAGLRRAGRTGCATCSTTPATSSVIAGVRENVILQCRNFPVYG